jgi:hypothetical protein
MARTVTEGFTTFLSRITPSEAERAKATTHRAQIEAKLDSKFGLYRMFESGSFRHGTGVSGRSDLDLFASLKATKPIYGSSALSSVRDALKDRFPSTYIHVARPAVVLDFGAGYERVEIIPAYLLDDVGNGKGIKYNIPGVATEWLESTPQAHLNYVNESNAVPIQGKAKGLARLVKAWKYYRNVPVSSFYLEMRAASYTRRQTSVVYWIDLYMLLKELQDIGLAAMNDPTGETGRINAYSSEALKKDAQSKLDTAVARARKAFIAASNNDLKNAFEQWDLLFGGNFPAYY